MESARHFSISNGLNHFPIKFFYSIDRSQDIDSHTHTLPQGHHGLGPLLTDEG